MVVQERSSTPTRQTRILARAVVVALLATLLVPLGQVESWATPVTLSETVDGVEVDPDTVVVDLAAADDPDAAGRPPTPDRAASVITEAPLAFSALGVLAPEHVTSISVRTSADGAEWTTFEPLDYLEAEDGPDPGSTEDRAAPEGRATGMLWVGEATHVQFEVEGGSPEDLEVTFIDSMRLNNGPVERHVETGAPADASGLDIVSRARWGADESLGSSTRTASEVHMGIVHHTAHSADPLRANGYTRDQAPGLVRAMHRYHTQSLGWSDLGYNLVIDKFGTVYEGRKGGFANGVIGAHARGYNTGSFGVAVIGNFVDQQAPAAAIAALTEVIGAKSAIHGIDPGATTTRMGDGRARPTILGHRDVGQTSCPGRIHDLLPGIRSDARDKAVRFPDVPATSPHRAAIIELADAGVTSGCTLNEYCPRDTLTRAQASTFVTHALELDPIPGSQFRDVPADGIHAGSINALVQREWLIGYPDGTFRPWQELTRGQLATLLANSLELSLVTPGDDPYPDVSRHATHAPAIAALAGIGIRGDCGSGRFCADDLALRDSTASFVQMARRARGEVTLNLSVIHRAEVDGVAAPTPQHPEPAYDVSVIGNEGVAIVEAERLAAGRTVTFTDDDGLRHSHLYRVQTREVQDTVPTQIEGCGLEEVSFDYAPSEVVEARAEQPVDLRITATASYTCSSG